MEIHILAVFGMLGNYHPRSDVITAITGKVSRDGQLVEIGFQVDDFLARNLTLFLMERG
jgi:hypothetical protein